MNAFAEGFAFVEKNTGNYVASELGSRYVQDVENEIRKFVQELNKNLKGNQSGAEQLKGFVAEHWHAGTFNIKSVVKGASIKKDGDFVARAEVLGSNKFGSADIKMDKKIDVGSKYYKTPAQTLRQHAKNAEDAYRSYKNNGGTATWEEYLKERNISDPQAPIYQGQIRLVPKEQLKKIESLFEKLKETDPEQAKKYEETVKMLSDRLKDGKGVESVPLDTETAQKLAEKLRETGVTEEQLAEMGLTTNALIGFADVMRQAFKAGATAAIITAVLKTAPEIYKAISELIKTGELDYEQFKKTGFAAVNGAGEGFISGAICAIMTAKIKIALSEAVKSLSKAAINNLNSALPAFVATVVSITITTMKNSYLVVKGDITRTQLANDLVRDIFVSVCSIGTGLGMDAAIWALTKISYLGLMLGSFIGSMLGSFVYDVGNKLAISFCVETGFTMFGLVEQNYELPDEVFESIGAEVFNYEEFAFEEFAPEEFTFEEFSTEPFMPEEISISVLRRGVISVQKIGYLC